MAPALLEDVLRRRLADPDTSWSVGSFGAIAEFHRERDEAAAELQPLGRSTARGSLRIGALDGAEGLAWEGPGGHGTSWSQGFCVHLPEARARGAERTTITRLPDEAGGALFDVGVGAPNVDCLVLVGDSELVALMDACTGRSLWADDVPAAEALKEAAPTRVFRSALAEVRVHQPIGRHGGRPTPHGPHTHVIRALLDPPRSHDATVPVPAGRLPVLGLHPPHPLRDGLGRAKPFARGEWDAFQELLEGFGPPARVDAKRALLDAAFGRAPMPERVDRGAARALLPQLAELGLPPERRAELARAWRLDHLPAARPSAPLDP